MNILILSWRSPKHPNEGGAEQVTLAHAAAWVKAGHKVSWFSSEFSGGNKRETISGVNIIRSGGYMVGVRWHAFLWYFFDKHAKFDLVVDEFHGIPFFTPLYVKAQKLGFIHEVAKEVWWLNPWPKPFNLIPGIFGTLFESLIFKLFYRHTSFMTVSESTKKDLINWGIPSDNVKVIHNGVNFIPTKIKKEKKKTVIFLGALAKDKGVEDAIKVFSLINKKEPAFQFWIVGYGNPDYLKELKNRSKKLGIGKRVKFWGFVDNRKKFELLSRAHILVNPSVREGWGLVNIEANSVGTPIVAYNVSGVRDSVVNNKTGLLSKFGDFESLAKNTIRLCNNADLYNAMSKNTTAWAGKFTWKKSTKESLLFIESLVSQKK